MGYSTDFTGSFKFDQPLTAAQVAELEAFNKKDHRSEHLIEDGAWCQWYPSEDGTSLVAGGEKFYGYVNWLIYLINRFFKPWGRVLNGTVEWDGEDPADQGVIHVKDNEVRAVENVITKPVPEW